MRVTLDSTDRVVDLATADGRSMPARIWQGTSEGGVTVIAFITRIGAARDSDLAQFEAELTECAEPTFDVEAWPARMVID